MASFDIERTFKIPENYDFSARKVNLKDYKNNYIIRTDAVWEKEKLKSYLYSIYKGLINKM